jgi:hypothetical protein
VDLRLSLGYLRAEAFLLPMTQKDYVELCRKNDKKGIIAFNKKMVEEYPFLLPRNRFSGEVVKDYDFSFTEMDSMPDGWRIAFGDELLKELKEELVKFNFLDRYRITQIKEKYGGLRWYDSGSPKDSKIYDIVSKYESLSEERCLVCGSPEVFKNAEFWGPLCEKCYTETYIKYYTK